MSTDTKKKEPAKTTTGRYSTVEELMGASGVSAETQKTLAEMRGESHLTSELAVMRTAAGITQEKMAEKLDCTQSCISKLESGADDDVTLKQLRVYAETTGQWLALGVGRPPNHVEAIKLNAKGIHDHLQALARIAHQGQDLEAGIQRFYNEALVNILSIIAKCQGEMPNGVNYDFTLEVSGAPMGALKTRKSVSKSLPSFGGLGQRKITA